MLHTVVTASYSPKDIMVPLPQFPSFFSFYVPSCLFLSSFHHTCIQTQFCNTFPLHCTHIHTIICTHARTVRSLAPHAANNFLKAINPGMTKYPISTAPYCAPSPDLASAKPYRNQLHKLNCSVRRREKVSSAHFDCHLSVKYLPFTPCPN